MVGWTDGLKAGWPDDKWPKTMAGWPGTMAPWLAVYFFVNLVPMERHALDSPPCVQAVSLSSTS